uniref:Type II secretion system protein M n=1 Tax=Candidatus Kentrum sp. SD TaxID=2126332 RepID=A0A450YZM1_9GAMM|nr:MAG: general secretion pathway protein M [Candidatus Kentron sp. SD]VFK46969.1 MAG: general secretion pathway protein M [Candidatus Kentron sp. SD]VFK79937.1 MAG: general secretion pathway protein M [Candidatus Kentron sp. SD]
MISKLSQTIGLDTIKPRERVAFVIGGVAILLAILRFLVIEPLHNEVQFLTTRVLEQKADLHWMQQSAREIIRLRENATAEKDSSHEQSLLIIVDTSAKKAGISPSIKRIEPAGEESVRVWIEEATFNNLLRWLGDLRIKGIYSRNITISRRKTPGRVNAQVTLGWLR